MRVVKPRSYVCILIFSHECYALPGRKGQTLMMISDKRIFDKITLRFRRLLSIGSTREGAVSEFPLLLTKYKAQKIVQKNQTKARIIPYRMIISNSISLAKCKKGEIKTDFFTFISCANTEQLIFHLQQWHFTGIY